MIAQMNSLYIKTRPTKVFNRLISYALFEGRPLTTRGRWINPLVFTLFSIEKRLPQLKKVEKPIFILGTGRSGTTILGIVLSMHKDVAFLNEPKALWHAVYPYEDVIGNYTRKKAFYRLDEKHVDENVKKYANRLYGFYLISTLSKRVVDKYPEMIFRVPFLKKIFPDAKFLFLVRNGWDTCKSIDTWSKRLGKEEQGEIHDWWGANDRKWNLLVEQIVSENEDLKKFIDEIKEFKNHTDRAAVEWIVTMKEGLKVLEKYPQNTMLVKYEELVNNPEKVLNNILEFTELDKDEIFINYGKNILKPAPPKEPYTINEKILPIFEKTMKQLGY